MVLMAMCDKKSFYPVNIILKICHIGNDEVNSVHIVLRK